MHLDKDAKKEWRRAGKVLQAIGLMTDLDMAVFASYCKKYGQWASLCRELKMIDNIIKSQDLNQKGITGRVKQYFVEYSIWDKAMEKMADGVLDVDEKGVPVFSPYLNISRQSSERMAKTRRQIEKAEGEAQDRMIKAGVQIGLSASSRASLKVENPKGRSKTEKFRNRKKG